MVELFDVLILLHCFTQFSQKPKTPSPKKRKHSSEEEEEDSEDDENKRLCYDENDEGFLRCDDIIVPPPPRPPGTIDALGPRMIILKIVNTNFKSYHNVQTLGPFHKNFNAIVGPNGSGKSNVIDSLLFVFGYRASKIRSRKLAVLIHDSKIYPNITSCTVAIHFILIKDKDNDPDGYDVIPDSELVVARTAHKDNSSFYQVNGKKVQYKEVAKLLREHGVDLDHNRFLILQGEVEQISLMKPKGLHPSETGMLEYLEDIVGTTRLKEPLDKAELKIDFLTELRNEKQNRVKMAEREKADLEEPMKEAVEFLKFENDLIKKKNKVFQRQLLQYESKIEENTDKKRVLTEKEDEFKEKLKTIGDEKKQREIDYKEHAIKYDKLNKQKEQLTESFDKANTKDINLQAEMVQINKRRKKVIELVKEETAKIEKNEKIPEKNQETIAEYQERAQQLTVQQEQLEAEKTELLSSLRDETGELLEQKELLQNQLTGLRKVVDQTKSTYNVAENELKIYQSAEVKPKEKLEKIKLTFENSKQKILCHTKNIKDLKQKIPEMEQQLKDTIDELGQNKIQEAKLMQEIKINRVSIEEFRSSQLASRSKGRILDFLTRQKDEGKLSGLFGRLGDLGAINQKYDVAVSTACGALDNIVADSVDTAQKSIQMLKTHNVGRATFIALEKQEHLRKQANSKINTPENVHRLFDLVTVEDDRVRTAFYYALRNTLVANDIEQATRIAYGPVRYRVVSLKGDLIETSGTMSGGGKQVSRGRMGQCVAVQSTSAAPSPKKKVEDMESALTKLEDKVRALHEQQQVLDQEVNTLQPELNRMKIDLEKFTMELQSLQKAQPSLAEQLKTQEKIVQAATINPAEVKKLENKVAATKTEYEKATSKSENIQKQVDVIVKQIDSKTQKKMKGVNSKLSECTEKLEKFKAELSKLKLAIKTAERVVKQSKEKITNFEQEKLECESKLKKNQAIRKEIETEAAGLLEEIEKIKEQMEEGESMFGEEKQKIAELTQKLNQTKSEKIELDQKLNEVNEALDGYVETKKRIEQKLSQLKFHEIPDEEVEKLEKFPEDILMSFDMKQLENEVRREEEQLKASTPNLTAIEAYRKKHEAYIQRVQDLEEIVSKRTKIREFRDNLRKMRQTEFRAGFNIISVKIKEMYQLITLGGDAELEFVDSYDPFTEGIVLNVRPPKKSWKNIINLSGGEKTLSSLALVFALHYFKPSPLYFMDEIDAALDFKNVSIVGNYIKERTKNAQFIIISLRSNMFELADHLIGIYKTNDMTQSITICPKKLVVVRQNIINSQPLTQNGGYPSLSQPLVLNGDVISNEESNDSFTHSIHPEDEARDPPSQLEGTDAGMECA